MSLFVEALELDGDSNVILTNFSTMAFDNTARLNSLPETLRPASAATDI